MPKYVIELHDGRKFQVEADRPPTEEEVLAQLGGQAQPPQKDTISKALDWLPTIGGAAGGAVGTMAGAAIPLANATGAPEYAGGVGGAALGGAAGEALRGLVERLRGTPQSGNPITNTLSAGVGQGAMEAGGQGIARVAGAALQKVAPTLYEMGLGRTPSMKRDFTGSAQRGVDMALIRPGSAQTALDATEADLKNMVGGLPQHLVTNPDQLATAAELGAQQLTRAHAQPQANQILDEITNLKDGFMASHPQVKTPQDLLDLKRGAQLAANYNAREPGKQVANAFNQSLAADARGRLGSFDPGILDTLKKEQDLMGLVRADEHNVGPSNARHIAAGVAGMAGGAGGGLPGFLLGTGLVEGSRNPYIMRSLGVGANTAGKLIGSTPAALTAADALRAAILGNQQ